MLQYLLAYLSNQRWVIALLVVFGVTVIAQCLCSVVLRRLMKHAQSTKRLIDSTLWQAAYSPAIALIWLIGLTRMLQLISLWSLNQRLAAYITCGSKLGTLVIVAWFMIRICKKFEENLIHKRKARQRNIDQTLARAVSQLCTVVILVVVTVVGMQLLGVPVSGLLTFGGIGSAAVAFAAKDLLANFFGGLVVYIDRPFKIGDWIKLPEKSIEGVVEYIGLRMTRICTLDKQMLYVPNGTFLIIPVQNVSRMKNRRIKMVIGLRYQDAAKINAITQDIKQQLTDRADVDQSLAILVNFTAFSASSLDLTLLCYTKATDAATYQSVQQAIFLESIDIIAKHGAECAFETRTVYLSKDTV